MTAALMALTDTLAGAEEILPFVDLATWKGRRPPERRFLVPGLVPLGCVTMLSGDGGSGKTELALSLTVAAAGSDAPDWIGQAVETFPTVGLFAEDDCDEVVRRVQRLSEAAGVPFDALAESFVPLPGVGLDTIIANVDPATAEIVPTFLMHSLLEKVRRTDAKLLILDYAAAIFGGNEIDRAQVSAFLRWLNGVAQERGIAILLLSHPSIEGMRGGRGTSGSTAWRNQARSFLHLTVDEEQDDEAGRRLLTLALTKSNYARSGLQLKLAHDGRSFEVLEQTTAGAKRPKSARLSASQRVAIKALNQAIAEAGEPSPGGPIPNAVRVVRSSLWRGYAYRLEISDASDEAKKRAFSRAARDLAAKGAIGICEPFVWIIDGGDK